MITYREKAGVIANKAGGHCRILVYIEGKFAGKIELLYPMKNCPKWRYLPLGHKRLAGEMFDTLEQCKQSLQD
jgi:hypothetical protein